MLYPVPILFSQRLGVYSAFILNVGFCNKTCLLCPKLSESKTVFNIFGSKIKEWWNRDQLLEHLLPILVYHLVNLIQMTINFLFVYVFYYLFFYLL
jgi:hypothetical protein